MVNFDANRARANAVLQGLADYYVAQGSPPATAATQATTLVQTAITTQKQNANPNTNIGNLRIRGLTTTL